jgi:hypothetical protein
MGWIGVRPAIGKVVGPALTAGKGGLIGDDLAFVAPWGVDPAELVVSVLLLASPTPMTFALNDLPQRIASGRPARTVSRIVGLNSTAEAIADAADRYFSAIVVPVVLSDPRRHGAPLRSLR